MKMSKKNGMEMLLNGWDGAMDAEGWYPPLSQALGGLTAEQALWRPADGASNSIWGTVCHLSFCKELLLHRLKQEPVSYPESNDKTFEPQGASEAEWEAAVAKLKALHGEIRGLLAGHGEDGLDEQVLNQLLHEAYHTGQIMQLRKMMGAWPATRSFG